MESCVYCSKWFIRGSKANNKMFCSRECKDKMHNANKRAERGEMMFVEDVNDKAVAGLHLDTIFINDECVIL